MGVFEEFINILVQLQGWSASLGIEKEACGSYNHSLHFSLLCTRYLQLVIVEDSSADYYGFHYSMTEVAEPRLANRMRLLRNYQNSTK